MDPTTLIAALATPEPRIPSEALIAARSHQAKMASPLRQMVKERLTTWEKTRNAPPTLDCLYGLSLLVEGRDTKAGHFCMRLASQTLTSDGLPRLPASVQIQILPGMLAHASATAPAALFNWFFHPEAPAYRLVPMQMTLQLLANCYGQRLAVVAELRQALASQRAYPQPERLQQIAELAGRLQATELRQPLASFAKTGDLDPDDWDDLLDTWKRPQQHNQQQHRSFLFSNADTFLRHHLGGAVIGDDLWIPDRIEKFLGQKLDAPMTTAEILPALDSSDPTILLPALRAARNQRRSLTPALLAILKEPASQSFSPFRLFHAMLLLGEFAEPRARSLLPRLPARPEMQEAWNRDPSWRAWRWSLQRCGGEPEPCLREPAIAWKTCHDPESGLDTHPESGAAEMALDVFLRSPAGLASTTEWR